MKRKFNGKYYKESMVRSTKKSAKEAAERIRKDGGLARVTKENGFYMVWER